MTPFQDIEREVIVVPEPITNKLLISATPKYYPDIMRLIHEMDAELPQVMIQVMIAEVDLTNTDEFGVEIGLQSPVLFQRSIFPAYGQFNGGTTSYTANATAPVFNTVGLYPSANTTPTGVAITGVTNSSSPTGFNFNQPGIGLGNNVAVAPGVVGYQGLTSLGVGRTSPNISGVGGFVFSASNDVFNLLIRALKTQGRIDVLSRPQIMTLDNQAASILIGSSVPYTAGTSTAAATTVATTSFISIGVQLNVIPKINPDGKVTMRVTPTVSKLDPALETPGVAAPAIDTQTIDTTIIAHDGETVAIGGLIKRNDQKTENKVPWFGDLPWIGTLFRYREQIKAKQELLIILTPHIVRNRLEAERILAMEGARMDWVLGDVVRMQGISGMDPLFPPPPHGNVDGAMPGPLPPGTHLPLFAPPAGVPAPGATAPDTLPPPRPISPTPVPAPTPGPAAQQAGPTADRPLQGLSIGAGGVPVGAAPPAVNTTTGPTASAPAAAATVIPTTVPGDTQGKESDRWRLTGNH